MSKSLFTIKPLTPADSQWVKQFIVKRWHAETVVAHGQEFYPRRLPGFVAVSDIECIGLVTYLIDGGSCEIITLDSLRPGLGVGTALIEAVKAIAQEAGCDSLWLMTTNDNLRALGFYQKCGFMLVAVHGGAVEKARQIKPSIPLIGEGGIPIRDEIELKMFLGGGSGPA
jgi:ribosomal protein S18 acetylase RimI-like enzyme